MTAPLGPAVRPATGPAIRPAGRGDEGVVLALIRELAQYERLAHEVDATREGIAAALFAPEPRVFCDLALAPSPEASGPGEAAPDGVAGFALWFYAFSTFRGRHGLHLEDLYVRPRHRGTGLGRALLAGLARRCVAEDLPRLEWSVLDWNAPAIALYRALGARPMTGWTAQRLEGEALAALARGDAPAAGPGGASAPGSPP